MHKIPAWRYTLSSKSLSCTHLLVIRFPSVLSSPLAPQGWSLSVMTPAGLILRPLSQYGHLRPENTAGFSALFKRL